MNKKSYFFTLDAMLSVGILVLGSFLIFTSYTKVPSKVQVAILSEDIMDFLSTTKIEELNNPYAGIGGELWSQGYIKNKDNTLLQQIGEFYYKYRITDDEEFLTIAEKFIINITNELIPPQFKSEFLIDDVLLHPSDPTQQHIYSKGNTSILLPSRKLTYGILNDDLFGPYEIEVLVWQ